MRNVAEQVQKMVFAVAQTFEKNGQYEKAIGYYLKVENRNDSVRQRIAACYKAKSDYTQAIKWLLEMQRTDDVLLEVVDCYKLDSSMKEAVYWLFEILKPWSGNSAELTALDLIEKYDYPQRKRDYPDFYQRLSDVYINKAITSYNSNFVQATRDYRKAVELLGNDMNESPSLVSFAILDRHQNNYRAALEILDRQKEAAERNFEDKVRRARRDIDDAEERLRRARHEADRDYQMRLDSAERTVRQAEDRLTKLKSSTTATPEEIARAEQNLSSYKRDLEHVRRNRESIIRDYMSPYHRQVEEARDAYDRLLASRTRFIEDYIAPYKRNVAEAKKAYDLIKSLHDANFK
jgi:tetratricopeptide (TPR) repeat protein